MSLQAWIKPQAIVAFLLLFSVSIAAAEDVIVFKKKKATIPKVIHSSAPTANWTMANPSISQLQQDKYQLAEYQAQQRYFYSLAKVNELYARAESEAGKSHMGRMEALRKKGVVSQSEVKAAYVSKLKHDAGRLKFEAEAELYKMKVKILGMKMRDLKQSIARREHAHSPHEHDHGAKSKLKAPPKPKRKSIQIPLPPGIQIIPR